MGLTHLERSIPLFDYLGELGRQLLQRLAQRRPFGDLALQGRGVLSECLDGERIDCPGLEPCDKVLPCSGRQEQCLRLVVLRFLEDLEPCQVLTSR